MMFCPKCKSLMMPKKEGNKVIPVCSSCGHKEAKGEAVKLSEKNNSKEKQVEVIEGDSDMHPVCKEKCGKCGNDEAYYYLQQTRAGDEAPTKFLKCTKCKHVWRDYD